MTRAELNDLTGELFPRWNTGMAMDGITRAAPFGMDHNRVFDIYRPQEEAKLKGTRYEDTIELGVILVTTGHWGLYIREKPLSHSKNLLLD